jgi:hypothetical protein
MRQRIFYRFMPSPLTKRLTFWKDIYLGRVRAGVALFITISAIILSIRDLFIAPEHKNFFLFKYIPEWPWYAWALMGLGAGLLLTLEGSFSKFQRDQARFRSAYRKKVREKNVTHKAELLTASLQGLGSSSKNQLSAIPVFAAKEKPAVDCEPEPAPNLVCKKTIAVNCHWEYGVLLRGHEQTVNNSNCVAYIAEISNDFRTTPKPGSVARLAAQIFYKLPGQQPIQVNRGAWLSGGNWTDLRVNDTDDLTICAYPVKDPFALVLKKDYTGKDMPDVFGILGDGHYVVEVRLISEAQGVIHKTLYFDLTVVDSPFKIELFQIDYPPPP